MKINLSLSDGKVPLTVLVFAESAALKRNTTLEFSSKNRADETVPIKH